jgi:hypothetical protein
LNFLSDRGIGWIGIWPEIRSFDFQDSAFSDDRRFWYESVILRMEHLVVESRSPLQFSLCREKLQGNSCEKIIDRHWPGISYHWQMSLSRFLWFPLG